jgi:RimJ/RimL family protein N-acetyltransferase
LVVPIQHELRACQGQHLILPDGSAVPFRQIHPDDTDALQRFHERLSETSVRLRFFGVMPHLSEAMAWYFTHVDGEQRFALVALDPHAANEIIGVVRFDREPGTTSAEYAAIVADHWQGHGLGLALTQRLIEAARVRGVQTLTAEVLPENARMFNLLRDLGLPERLRHGSGIEHVEVSL